MRRRSFLISSGASIGGGLLSYNCITSKPSLASTANIQTPNNQTISDSISFTFDSFKISGSKLPADGSIDITYGLVDSQSSNVKSNTYERSYSGQNVDYTTEQRTITVSDENIGSKTNYALRIKIQLNDSSGNTSFITSEESDTFSITNAIQVVDDFEDGDTSEYGARVAEGTLTATTISSPVKNGSQSLKLADSNSRGRASIASDSGLSNYPNQGDTTRAWMQATDDGVQPGFTIAGDGTINDFNIPKGYTVFLDTRDEKLRLDLSEQSNVTTLATTGFSFSINQWYEVEITYATDDTLTVELFNNNGDSVADPISATDATFSSNTGIGWVSNSAVDGVSPEIYADYARVI